MLVNPAAEAYASTFTSDLSPLLQEVLDYTRANHAHHHMLSGHSQGLFLQFVSCMLQPKRILEIGTFTGFSALCLVEGLVQNGELHTIELRAEDAETARAFFERHPSHHKIHLHTGNAAAVIPTLDHAWDLVFIDADKTGYIQYYDMLFPQLKSGALMIADNVLFHGEVLRQAVTGRNAIAIAAFNAHVKNDPAAEQVMLTLRDGLMLIRKRM